MKFIIATHNKGKIEEFRRILSPLGIETATEPLDEVEETGGTFAENAYLKAQAACRQTGLPAVADDSGLMVDALGGAPGVYSARYAGEGASDADRIQKLLHKMEGIPKEQRGAKFVCSICCVFPDGHTVTAQGECPGEIAFAPQGAGGFGYDPVFLVNGKSFARFSPEEKDAVSHRGLALRQFSEKIKDREQRHADQ